MPWMARHKRYALLIAILLIAGLLRTIALTKSPPGLYLDEAVVGYDAYSLWHTGRDHHGAFLPIALRAFNDYRGALFSYLMAPLVGLGGLYVFTVRLASSYLGILVVAAAFRATYELCRGRSPDRRAATAGLAAAGLLAILPWHVHFSRMAIETNSAALLMTLTVIGFARWRRTAQRGWLLAAAVFAGLGLYTYAVMKLTLPLIVGSLAIVDLRRLWIHRREVALAGLVGLCIATPMMVQTVRHPEQMQDHFRQISIAQSGESAGAILREAGSNLIANLTPRYLFVSGSPDLLFHPQYGGQLPLTEAPLILLGVVSVLGGRKSGSRSGRAWVIGWLLITLVPAILTHQPSGTGNPQRTLPAVVPWEILAGLGVAHLATWQIRPARLALGIAFVAGLTVEMAGFYTYYFREYPREAAATFHAGMDELVSTIETYVDDYDVIYFTPFTNDLPYIHVLFFSRYDPAVLQNDLPVTDPTAPDRVVRLGKFMFVDQSVELWQHGMPGLYVVPQGAVDAQGADLDRIVPRPAGLPSFEVLGRSAPPVALGRWIAQCSVPVPPLAGHVLDQIAGPRDARRTVFDCTQTWLYPGGNRDGVYILHRDALPAPGTASTWLDSFIDPSRPAWQMDVTTWGIQPFSAYQPVGEPPDVTKVPRATAPADTTPLTLADLYTTAVPLSGGLTFLDAAMRPATPDGTPIEFMTTWRVTAPITRAFSIMAHIVTLEGEMLGAADALGVSPLELRPGDVFVQRHVLAAGSSAEAGVWLRTGAYWLDTSERWTVDIAAGSQHPSDAIFVDLTPVDR